MEVEKRSRSLASVGGGGCGDVCFPDEANQECLVPHPIPSPPHPITPFPLLLTPADTLAQTSVFSRISAVVIVYIIYPPFPVMTELLNSSQHNLTSTQLKAEKCDHQITQKKRKKRKERKRKKL